MRNNRGIAIIALVIILFVIGIGVTFAVKYAHEYINNEKNEDIKSTMFSIQRVITNVKNKHTIDEENNALIGTSLDLENNETEYIISDELKGQLLTLQEPVLYILSQEEINNNGIKDVNINNEEFYIVDYNSEDIIYSLGINGTYKLSEM